MTREINDPGGEYVSVIIEVNGNVVFKRDCVLSDLGNNGIRTYKVDDSDTFTIPNRPDKASKDDYKGIANRLMMDRGSR